MLLALVALALLASAGGELSSNPQLPPPESPRLPTDFMDPYIAGRVKQVQQQQAQLQSGREGEQARAATAPVQWVAPTDAAAKRSAEPYVDLSAGAGGITQQAAGGLGPQPDPFHVDMVGAR
jgi:hypothetical protein